MLGIGQGAPRIHVSTNLVDDGGGIVLLLLRRDPLPLIEDEGLLFGSLLALLRLRNRRNKLCLAPEVEDLLSRLPTTIQFPVPSGYRIGRIEDGVVKEGVRSGSRSLPQQK